MSCWVNGATSATGITSQTTGGCATNTPPSPPACLGYYAIQQGPQHYIETSGYPPANWTTTINDTVCNGGLGSITVHLAYPTPVMYYLDQNPVVNFTQPISSFTVSNIPPGIHFFEVVTYGIGAGLSGFGYPEIVELPPAIGSSNSITACDNYYWPMTMNTYTSSGQYYHTYTNSSGCTMLNELNLTVNQSTNSSSTVSSCVPYFWSCTNTTLTQSGTYTCSTINAAGCNHTETLNLTVNPCTVNLNLSVYLQGFYLGAGFMQALLYNQGLSNSLSDCDDVTVELHQSVFPYTLAYSYTGTLKVDGQMTCTFPPGALGNTYYVVVKQRNHLEIWSANPITMATTTSYSFSTAASQAYSSNQVEIIPGLYGMYAGDLNQDKSIDVFDYIMLEPEVIAGNTGYLLSDLNGDGTADIFDYLVVQDFIVAGVTGSYP